MQILAGKERRKAIQAFKKLKQSPNTEKLDHNINWLITGQGDPFGITGDSREKFIDFAEETRKKLVEALGNTKVENDDDKVQQSIYDILQIRVQDESWIDKLSKVSEEDFNSKLSLLCNGNESFHSLLRWLIEAEFIDEVSFKEGDEFQHEMLRLAEIDRSSVKDGNPEFPLLISRDWQAISKSDVKYPMGPASRMIGYWLRGEYIGSISPFEIWGEQLNENNKKFRIDADSENRRILDDEGDDRTVLDLSLYRKIRLHSTSRVNISSFVQHSEFDSVEWTLYDQKRMNHVLSESVLGSENSEQAAMRGIEEELEIKLDDFDRAKVQKEGETRLELGSPSGPEGFDSRTFLGLPSLYFLQDYNWILDEEMQSKYLKVQNGIPTRKYSIHDAGEDTKLIWMPKFDKIEKLHIPVDGKMDNGVKYFRILHQHEEFDWLHKLISLSITHHLENDYQHSKFIGKKFTGNDGEDKTAFDKLYEKGSFKSKKDVGVSSLYAKSKDIESMFASDERNSTFVVQDSKNKEKTNNNFMQKLTEVFQPDIGNKIAYQHLVSEINEYRKSVPNVNETKQGMSKHAKEFSKSNLKRNIDPIEIDKVTNSSKKKELREKLNAIFDIFNDPENWKIPLNFVEDDGKEGILTRELPKYMSDSYLEACDCLIIQKFKNGEVKVDKKNLNVASVFKMIQLKDLLNPNSGKISQLEIENANEIISELIGMDSLITSIF